MKKVIFVINVDNHIDLITNSSSELFVLNGETKEVVEEMIKEVYSEYLTEYERVKNITELTVDELDTYIEYTTHNYSWNRNKRDKSTYPVLPGFTFDEMYELDTSRWGDGGYKLIENEKYTFVTEENKDWVIEKMNPKKDMYFLFSLDQNPDSDKQGDLETIAMRYHLG